MFKKLRNFIKKIQKADLKTRKKWFFIFSFSLIFFIIILWIFYFNLFFFNNELFFLEKMKQEWLFFKLGYEEIYQKIKQESQGYLKQAQEKIARKKEIDIKATTTIEDDEIYFENVTTTEEFIKKILENFLLVLTSTTSTNNDTSKNQIQTSTKQ